MTFLTIKLDFVWPANAIQPIQVDRINDLPKTGRLTPHAPLGAGSNPVDLLYVQPDGCYGSRLSGHITMLPVSHNVDSFGYRMDMLPKGLDINQESWSWLRDKRWKGTLDAAYDYLNWWISGWPSSVMTRQGYYISTPELTRPHLSAAEWDFWYGGKPATKSLPGPVGTSDLFHRGEIRDGGDYQTRMSRIAVWNTVMDEHNYLVRRWNDFMSA